MKNTKPIRVEGFGKYLPLRVSSSELEAKYHFPSGWSERYSGVAYRHYASFESNGYMGARAIENALENTGTSLSELDMIICASATFDYPLPNRASVIKSELKASREYHIPTIDIDCCCLSFVAAFEYASSLLDGMQYRKIIIVSSEIASKALDPQNPEICTLFGDAAVAVILAYDEKTSSSFIKGGHQTWSEGVYDTMIKGGGNKYFFKEYPYSNQLHAFSMNGKNLLRMAKSCIPVFMEWFFKDLGISLCDVDAIIPHQASKAGLALFKSLYPLREGQVKQNLLSNGNCIAASIPLAFADAVEAGEIKRGDTCFLSGTSAGFSIGGVLIKY